MQKQLEQLKIAEEKKQQEILQRSQQEQYTSNEPIAKQSTLIQNGNNIFNSSSVNRIASQTSSKRSNQYMKYEQFEKNFQKPMADRQNRVHQQDFKRNTQLAAGQVAPKLQTNYSVTEGKSRLFGLGETKENLQRSGKKTNISSNVMPDYNSIISNSNGVVNKNYY